MLLVNDLSCWKLAECQEKPAAVQPIVTGSFNSSTIMSFACLCVCEFSSFLLSFSTITFSSLFYFCNNNVPPWHPSTHIVFSVLSFLHFLCLSSQWKGWRWWRLRNVAVTLRSWGRRWPPGTTGLCLSTLQQHLSLYWNVLKWYQDEQLGDSYWGAIKVFYIEGGNWTNQSWLINDCSPKGIMIKNFPTDLFIVLYDKRKQFDVNDTTRMLAS